MACDDHFYPFNSSSSSLDNEITITTHCTPNSLKLAVFILGDVLFFLLGSVYAFMFYLRLSERRKWDTTLRSLLLNSIFCYIHVIFYSMLLSGIHSKGIYFLCGVLQLPQNILAMSTVYSWITACRNIPTAKDRMDQMEFRFRYIAIAMLIFFGWLYVIFWCILPVVNYDDPSKVNTYYIAGYMVHGVAYSSQSFIMAVFATKILAILEPDDCGAIEKSQEIIALINFLKYAIMTCKIATPILFAPTLLIFWLEYTKTETNPGLEGFFYYEFFWNSGIRWMTCLSSLRALIVMIRTASKNTSPTNSGGIIEIGPSGTLPRLNRSPVIEAHEMEVRSELGE